MATNLDNQLVIGIASSALFDLSEGHAIFQAEGPPGYRDYQAANKELCLEPGPAFEFVRKLLKLNELSDEGRLVDVVLLSRNSPDTGYRVMNSIHAHDLDITRAVFTEGESPYVYHEAFGVDLFLSGNKGDVREAIQLGCPAGMVTGPGRSTASHQASGTVCLAFDFDGVLADDASERVYASEGLTAFQVNEVANQAVPANDGPIKPFFMVVAHIQALDKARESADPTHKRMLRTSIVTARSSPAEVRVLNSLDAWGIDVDDAFFLGGIDKGNVLSVLKPDIFFDDQLSHIESAHAHTMSAHVIFGVRNN